MNQKTETNAEESLSTNIPPPPDLSDFSAKGDTGGTQSFEAATAFGAAFDKLKAEGKDLTFDDSKVSKDKSSRDDDPGFKPSEIEKPQQKESPKVEKTKEEVKSDPKAASESVFPSAEDLASIISPKKETSDSPAVEADEMPETLKNSTKKAQQAWAEQREALKQEKRRAEELAAKVAELEKNKFDPAEIERLKKINEEYDRELQVARVEATQEYKEAVLAPLGKVQESVTNLATKYDISPKDLFESLADPEGDKITDLAAGMNDRDRFRLYEMADQFSKVRTIRDRVVSNAKLALEKINAAREEQAKTQFEEGHKSYNQAVDSVWKSITEAAPILRKVEGNDEWNKQIDEAESFARNAQLGSPDPSIRAGIAWRAALSPMLYNQVQKLYTELKEAQSQLSKYTSAKPKAGGGASPADAPGTRPQYDDFLDALKDNLRLG